MEVKEGDLRKKRVLKKRVIRKRKNIKKTSK